MKKVLVTGSSGHSGSAILKSLRSQYEVIGVDLINGPETDKIGSIADSAFVNKIMKSQDAVIHTASLHAPHIATHTREQFIDVNIKGTLNLLEAAKTHGVSKFVYTSTTSLYGEQFENDEQAAWITEELSPIPRDIYDITKITAEQLCKDFHGINGLETVVLRVSRFWNEPLPNKVFYRMYRGVDVRDVVYAHELALKTDLGSFQIFNISAQSPFTPNDLKSLRLDMLHVLQEKAPSLLKTFKKRDWQLPSFIDRIYVIEKAQRLLGYQPRYNIQHLLEEIEQQD